MHAADQTGAPCGVATTDAQAPTAEVPQAWDSTATALHGRAYTLVVEAVGFWGYPRTDPLRAVHHADATRPANWLWTSAFPL